MKRLIFFALVIVLAALPLGAQATHPEMVVTTDWLADHLDKVIVLDVADRATYDAGHIAGARLIEPSEILITVDGTPNELPPVADLEALFTRLGAGDKDRLVIYSRDPIPAFRAWFTLDAIGAGRRAAILDGGYAKWTSEARAVSTETPVFEPAAFRATPNVTAITNFKSMKQLVHFRDVLGKDLVMIDARSPQQYCGEEAGAEVRRAGHIPGAKNVPWNDNLIAGAIPRLMPDRELRELYAIAGVTPKSTNIVYCRTGTQAAVNYFVLRYLGHDVSLYDGSFVEWSGSGSTVVAQRALNVPAATPTTPASPGSR